MHLLRRSPDSPSLRQDRPSTQPPVGAAISGATQLRVGAVAFALAVVAALLRQRGTSSWRTIWAEGGFVFFEQARHFGAFQVLFTGTSVISS